VNRSEGQWEQLPMFMRAGEIKSKVNASADPGGGDMEHLWKYKLREAKTGAIRNARYQPTRVRKGASLYDSIKREGVKKPVELIRNFDSISFRPAGYQLGDGHHRVAAAADIDPNMLVPVEHDEWRKRA
jgi:chorismate synthase